MKYCSDLALLLPLDADCCTSCHEDADDGYEMIYQEINGEEYHICCSMSNYYDEMRIVNLRESGTCLPSST